MDGTFVITPAPLPDLFAILSAQQHGGVPRWARPRWLMRYATRGCGNSIRARVRNAMSRQFIMTSTSALIRCFSIPISNTVAPTSSSDQSAPMTLNSPRSVTSPPKLLWSPTCGASTFGCGWGGLALYLAEIGKARVTGITLSEQPARDRPPPRRRARPVRERWKSACRISRRPEQFDRVVSVGMFEHVASAFMTPSSVSAASCSKTTA